MIKQFKGSEYQPVLIELALFKPDPDKVYTLEIKEKKKKRSLDANAYCWALIGKISKVVSQPPENVYREFIHRGNAYTVVPIKIVAVVRYQERWEGNGLGWIAEDLGESKLEGFHNLRCYHGSSSYTTEEMSRLIDEIVSECKYLGIETATGSELALLKEGWK